MRLVSLTTQHARRKVVIDADKVLALVSFGGAMPVAWPICDKKPEPGATGTLITFAGDSNPDGGLVVAEDIDTVVNRIRSAVALNERV